MTERWIGLFGFGNWGSTVRSLGLIDVNVNGDGYVGGVMGGHYQGRITACFSTGQVSGHDIIGGLIGRSSRGKITTSYSTSTVSGDDDVGGLVGWLETNGLAVVRASYATGPVSGDQHVAGLVGYHASGTIEASYATGSVSGNGQLAAWRVVLVQALSPTAIGILTAPGKRPASAELARPPPSYVLPPDTSAPTPTGTWIWTEWKAGRTPGILGTLMTTRC